MREQIKFCFKGHRNYVHGTDIFNAVCKNYQNASGNVPTDIEMSIHHITRNNMTLVMQEELLPAEKSAVNIIVKEKETIVKIALLENEEKVECKYDYPENDIITAAKFNEVDKTITLINYHQYTLIEKLVALNKSLLQALFTDAEGQWYFVKIKLANVDLNNQNPREIKLSFKKNMNFKLTQTEILVENKSVGNIYFSLV